MSVARDSTGIAVIGAGVVGHCVALRLAEAGHEVTMVAPEALGDGTAWGNAGVIADYAVLPVGSPDMLRATPGLLFGQTVPPGPLRRALIFALAPWLPGLARRALPGAVRRTAQAMAALMADAAGAWHEIAAEIGAADLLARRGALYLYDSAAALAAARSELAWRAAAGVRGELLGPDGLHALEPALPAGVAEGALFFPDTLSVTDPAAMHACLARAVRARGIRRILARAETLRRRGGGVEIGGAGFALRAARAVIAAGAHSRPLALAAGDRVPLETERGYHLEYDMPRPPLSRPVSPVRRRLHLCPMQGRLRIAGPVERGGLQAPPAPDRLIALEEGARAILCDLPAPDRSWMGLRPSVPDGVPVIGPSRAGDEILMAFGHGHLALTLAPVTARIVAALVARQSLPVPLRPYLPGRF
jgi:D-amino-acid dehydrogenase